MRHFILLLACLLVVSSLSACSKPATPVQLSDKELDEGARTFVRFMAEAKPGDAVAMMESRMAAAMPAAKIAETWQLLVSQAGAFDSVTGTRLAVEAGYKCVYVTCKFKDAALDAKVVFDASGKVTGLWFANSPSSTASYKEPSYADVSAFSETECTVGAGQWKLPATLTMPKGDGPFPAVVLVHGSGPNDRDETVGPNKPFKDLAWGLASRRIAVLRYEKRTKQYANEMAANVGSLTVKEEVLDDALSAIELLRRTKGVDASKVFVVGHSLGASLAPRIASERAERGESLAGIVMLAPNARDILELMVEQVEYIAALDGATSDAESSQLQKVRQDVAKIREGRVQQDEIVLGGAKAYWDDLLAYDPLKTLASVKLPVLILQGERDYQVTMEDFGLWKTAFEGTAGVTQRSFATLNHLFMPGQGKSSPAEYQSPGNVDSAVIDAIVAWLRE